MQQSRRPRGRRPPRRASRFETWATSPIVMFRIALVGLYIGCVYFGLVSFIGGVPAFRLTAPDGYVVFWSAGVAAGATVAAVGAINDTRLFRWIELAGVFPLFVATGTYTVVLHYITYGMHDPSRQAVSAALTALTVIPACRLAWLLSQLGTLKAGAEQKAEST